MRRGGRGPVAHAVRPRGSAPPRAHGAIAARGRRLSYTFQPACRRGHADADEGAQRGQAGGRRPLRDRRRGAWQPLALLEPAGAKAPRLFLLLVRRVQRGRIDERRANAARRVCDGPVDDRRRTGGKRRERERERTTLTMVLKHPFGKSIAVIELRLSRPARASGSRPGSAGRSGIPPPRETQNPS